MAQFKYISLENIQCYDSLIKQHISKEDAKALKSVSITGNILNFYKVETPTAQTAADFSIEIPKQDLSTYMKLMNKATAGNVVIAKTDGSVEDGGKKLADLATKEEVTDAQTTLQGNIDANKTVLDRLDGAASVTGSVKKQIADAKADLEKKIADSTYNDTDLTARVAANESSITKLNGADTVTGSVAKQVKDAKDTVESKIGILTNLATASKGNVVGAVNEVKSSIDSLKTSSAISVDTTNTTSGMAKSYQIKQGAKLITTIDIPKDMVVKSGTVEKNPVGQASGTYLVLTLANATNDKVYINVGTLVDIYTAQASATQVQLTIDSTTREISAVIVAGSIGTTELANGAVTTTKIADANVTKAKLDKTVQASLDKADTALQESNVSALRTDVSNIKTSLADGGATAKAIAAAKKAGDDAQTSVTALEQRVTGLEGNTFTAITNEQIEALFAKIN